MFTGQLLDWPIIKKIKIKMKKWTHLEHTHEEVGTL